MTTSDLVSRLKNEELNRPSDDDLFTDPDDYHGALTKAQRYFYRRTASHYPGVLVTEKGPISSDDDGRTYDLGDDHYSEMEVWTPPGPPTGTIIPPAVPESGDFGYYTEGQLLKLTRKKDYSPGIYIRWVPATVPPVDNNNDPTLPNYFEDALVFRAAYHLAKKPGYLGDPDSFKDDAREEWAGDPEDPSDAGLLGTLSRQSAHRGREGRGSPLPWYKRIG